MVMVRPFRGLMYNPEKVGSFDRVLAPPYDVITPSQQEELYRRSPFNVVRVILSKEPEEVKYQVAGETFRKWIADGILVRDDEPAVYPFYQEFVDEGRQITRKGFIAVVRLEDFETGKILPHEQTFSAPKADRLKLTIACRANLSPVFCVYSDPEGGVERRIDDEVSRKKAIIDVTDGDGVRHMLWKISDPALFAQIGDKLRDLNLLIADGHHRYETALNFRNLERRHAGETNGEREYDYVMMFICRAESEGLIIKPTHRLVRNLRGLTLRELLKRAREHFEVDEIGLEELNRLGNNEFAVYADASGYAYRLTPKHPEPVGYRNLAVMQLHRYILGSMVSVVKEGDVVYEKSLRNVLDLVRRGEFALAFILPPTSALDIMAVTLAGEKMPHKTTYFYPKVLSGLVFHLLD
jgi:uncharacterized protein (DUF1015 family)